jgi:hypothetical protein
VTYLKNGSPYQTIARSREGRHPVDELISKFSKVQALERMVDLATKRLEEALGEDRSAWMWLEPILNDLSSVRQEAFFNLGYQHGFVAGEAETLRIFNPELPTESEYRHLAERLRETVIQSALPLPIGVAALAETTWALSLDARASQRS